MIVRRYGTTIRSAVPHFAANALTEVSFRRDGDFELAAEEFDAEWSHGEPRELTATAEGSVQAVVEEAVLEELLTALTKADADLGPGEVLLVENGPGPDHPKLREERDNVIVEGENRLYFRRWVEPPLRVSVHRRPA